VRLFGCHKIVQHGARMQDFIWPQRLILTKGHEEEED